MQIFTYGAEDIFSLLNCHDQELALDVVVFLI
jgi:hypothetical protein